MSSQQIYDDPRLLEEGAPLLDLTEATKHFPIKCSRATIERFVRRGARNVKLATVTVGGRRYTTASAIRDFLVAQQRTEPGHTRTETKRGNKTEKEIIEASKRFGLPLPSAQQAAANE
jgi:hypothetical protein